MRITAVNSARPPSRPLVNMTDIARRAVHAVLNRLSVGSLALHEEGQVRYFGTRDGSPVEAVIQVRDPAAYLAVLRDGSTGAGEAYMQGWWDSPDLLRVIRLFVLNMHALEAMERQQPLWRKVAGKVFHLLRANSRQGSRRNIAAHYDLDNRFFSLFLDPTMAYSAAIFKHEADTLHDASINKFQHICERLQLQPTDHLLEIGTGWGGLAIHAARHFGCRVTTTTISRQQYEHARDWVAREGLADRITVLEKDYRELDGRYDKLVSVEMIEAVGVRYYDDYFSRCSRLLAPGGLMLIQAITISDQRYTRSVNSIDFIKRYIFPGGQLPSNAVIAGKIATRTDMQLIGLEDITADYARTLEAWRRRFWKNIREVRQLGCDELFIRMWHFYLCFCEGGFRERVIHTGQFLLAKPAFRFGDQSGSGLP